MIIIGLNASFYFGGGDSSACLIIDGKIVGACEEERFTRIKHGRHQIPVNSIKWLIKKGNITISDVDVVAFNTIGNDNFRNTLIEFFLQEFACLPKKFKFYNHQLCHAALAYWGSGWKNSAILSFDYSGDGLCGGFYEGINGKIKTLDEILTSSGNSLGKFYATFTQFLGFNRGDEYKLMGLSSYGNRNELEKLDEIIYFKNDSFSINPEIYSSIKQTSIQQKLFNIEVLNKIGFVHRIPEAPVNKKHKKLAISVQVAFEKATILLVKKLRRMSKQSKLSIAGGCAMNCVAISKIRQSKLFKEIFVPPASGDAGTSMGAAYLATSENVKNIKQIKSAALGPAFNNTIIKQWIDRLHIKSKFIKNVEYDAAKNLIENKLIGWFQGGMEFGSRALGHRSILANPKNPHMKDLINKKIKFRESFRPFAPSILENSMAKYFKNSFPSPYMNEVFEVTNPQEIPAVTHVDKTARVHTVKDNDDNKLFYSLLEEIETMNGTPMVLNTSLNINNQPIVCSPQEAIYTFFSCGLDIMYLGNWKITK